MSRTSLKSLAQHLGLSPSTVSRALRNHPDINEKTKVRVHAAARDLDYFPDSIAQGLKNKSTRTIGVIVPEFRNFFFSSVISGIESCLYDAGYSLVVCQSHEDADREAFNVRTLVGQRVAGVLVSIAQNSTSLDHFRFLRQRNIPYVFFDRAPQDPSVTRVVVDDEGGALAATEHLIERGYRHIAHLAGPETISIAQHRERGFRRALAHHAFTPGPVIRGGLTEEDGRRGMIQLLSLDHRPDAVLCVTDPVAIGAFTVLKERGLRIPGDCALAGFSNNPITSLIDPPLTTVEQPSVEIGHRAAALLLRQVEHPMQEKAHEELLLTSLVIRQST
jgi:DNA-binding LacI/PurR family transcriptional regulator